MIHANTSGVGQVVSHRDEVAATPASQFEDPHRVEVGDLHSKKRGVGRQPVGVCGPKRHIVVPESVVGSQIRTGAV